MTNSITTARIYKVLVDEHQVNTTVSGKIGIINIIYFTHCV